MSLVWGGGHLSVCNFKIVFLGCVQNQSVGKSRATMSAVWAESYDICGVGRELRCISGACAELRYLWYGEELRCFLCGGSV